MSMLDSFFSKGAFKASKCKTLLKLTIPRIKLLRNRREIQLKQMRREIANLLQNGQEATARIRVEHIIREENMMAAQEIIELFCELISVRLPIIETQRECPLDLKEAISSICFAAPRCSDLPELHQVQMLFAAKYGKEFVAAASELRPDCGVNRQIIELLSVRAPSVEAKLKLLKEIAAEHEVDWDPAESEKELLKPHEDLLNGPNHLFDGSALHLPNEKEEDPMYLKPDDDSLEDLDSDEGLNDLDLPEVPRASVQPPAKPQNLDNVPAPPSHEEAKSTMSTLSAQQTFPPSFPTPPHESSIRDEKFRSVPSHEDGQQNPHLRQEAHNQESSTEASFPQHDMPADAAKKIHFSPFIASPPTSPPVSLEQDEPVQSARSSGTISQIEDNVDLEDVLAAAHAAAETAERAAAAARAAASLAQVRITELVSKRSKQLPLTSEEKLIGDSDPQKFEGQPKLMKQMPSGLYTDVAEYMPRADSNSPTLSSYDQSPKSEAVVEHQFHQPQRSTSLEEDPYFAYPNLFTSQNSFRKSS